MSDKLGKNKFSGWATAVFWLLILIFVGQSITHMVGAGDTWVAMACGRHFLNQGFNNVTFEPFSANSHKSGPTVEGMKKYAELLRQEAKQQRNKSQDSVFLSLKPTENEPVRRGSTVKAAIYEKWADFCDSYEKWPQGFKSFAHWIHPTGWVNQNWLTHIIFYWLTHHVAGTVNNPDFNALVWWKFIIYLILAASVYFSARIVNISKAGAAVAACASVFIGRSFYDIRPAGFSNTLVAVLLLIFVLTNYRNYLYIWLLVPLISLWCNLHGGYIYAFMVLVPFIGTHFLLLMPKKWRIIFYSIGGLLLFVKTLIKISNSRYVESEQQIIFLSMIGFGIILIIGGFIFAKYKDKFAHTSLRGLIHIIAASAVSFIAALFLNPYKLTNFTHTLIVSVSEHAKMWRQVHEWHPAFSWSNPVGTSIPFLIAIIILCGISILWLYNYIIQSYFTRTKPADGGYKIWQYFNFITAAIVAIWSIMLSLQFMNVSAGNLFASAVFAILVVFTFEISKWTAVITAIYCIMLLFTFGSNNSYSGAYIYSFLIIPSYSIYALARSYFKQIKTSDILIIAASGLTAIIATLFIAGSSMGFEAITFTSKFNQFWTMAPAFKPEFYSGGNTDALVSNHGIFTVLTVANAILPLIVLLINSIIKSKPVASQEKNTPNTEPYIAPKIDLSLIIIMLLSVYIALVSRRFITVAGIWVAFFAVVFFEQTVKTACAMVNFNKFKKFFITPLPLPIRNIIVLFALGAIIFFGSYWGLKYKQIYLAPSVMELNHKYATVFMRMTASNVKPFEACQFIRENNISGNMYNYWTEGGFIAYGQTPDPNTGKTPLQLYMDGRAQAAYEPQAYRDWISIMGGGPIIGRALSQNKRPSQSEYQQAGEWINDIFKKKSVWIVLMPSSQIRSEFMIALTSQKNWQCVFVDDNQRIYVDTETEKGNELINGLFNGKVKFPDSYSEQVTKAYNFMRTTNTELVNQGFEYFSKAITQKPGVVVLELMQIAMRHQFLYEKTQTICQNYIQDFSDNLSNYRKQDGIRNRSIIALTAMQVLANLNDKNNENTEPLKSAINNLPEMDMDDYRW